jgi:alpha-tubulin suppressor-like RCC1 family protein
MRAWVVVVALAGCDKLLSLDDLHPRQFVTPGPTTIAGGAGHTCWIRGDGALFCWGKNGAGQLGIGAQLVENDVLVQVGTDPWIAISAAADSTCGIQQSGSLWCWGDNSQGQLGTGDVTNHDVPTQIAGKWLAVSAGGGHACAVDAKNTVWCWGDNGDGELGDGTTTAQLSPEQIATGYLAISTSGAHTCAIRTDHTLACWGRDGNGELGDGTIVDSRTPTVVAGDDRWIQVEVGAFHTCGLTADGHVRCWGGSYGGQLGNGTSDQHVPGSVLIDGADRSDWLGVASSLLHSCAWKADVAYCWGDSSHGELGVDGDAVVAVPTLLPGGPWQAVALGDHHACAIDASGAPWCLGANGWGQLGTGTSSQLAPTLIATTQMWSTVYVGFQMACAIGPRSGTPPILVGKLACAGYNYDGELGTSDRKSRNALPATLATDWYTAAPGDNYACALDYRQSPYCWGANGGGQLGDGTTTGTGTPQAVMSTLQFGKIATSDHTCAKDVGANLYCWGHNEHGQVGMPASANAVDTPTALAPPGAGKWGDFAVGDSFTCTIYDATNSGHGNVYCWGINDTGQLGGTSVAETYVPTPVSPAIDVSHIWAGPQHACAADDNGNAWCWGYGPEGQLGNGATPSQSPPVAVSGQWPELALGYYHTCGISPSGTLACWGDDRRGQLGIGDTSRAVKSVPQMIDTSAWGGSVLHVAAGGDHTCAVTTDQVVRCWGSNDDGALLDGKGWTTTPVQVPAP